MIDLTSEQLTTEKCILKVKRDGQVLDVISGSYDLDNVHEFAGDSYIQAITDCLSKALDQRLSQELRIEAQNVLRFVPDGAGHALVIIQTTEPSLAFQVLDNTNTAIIIADVQQEDIPIVYVNRTFTEVTGYSAEETIGKNARFLQGNSRNQPGATVMRQAIADGTDCRVVVQNFRKNGEAFWNEVYLSPIRSTSGQITHYVGVQNDVTEQRQVEDALKLSEANLSAIFDHIPISIVFIDPDFQIRAVNKLARQTAISILGDAYETMENFITYMPEDRKTRFIQYFNRVLSGETVSFEHQLPTMDDQIRAFHTTMIPLRPQHSDVIGICLISTDTTQQKQTEEALRTSEQRYRDIVRHQPDFVCRFSPDTTLTFVNDAYARYFGRSREELVGHSFLSLVPEHEHEGIRQHIVQVIEGGVPVEYDHEAQGVAGETRWQRWIGHANL